MPRKQLITFSVLGTLTIAAAAVFYYGWSQLLLSPFALIFGGDILRQAIIFTVGAILFLSFISMTNLLVSDTRCRVATFLFASLAIFPIFQFDPKVLVFAFFLFLILLLFSIRSQTQIKNHLHFSASHLFGPTLETLISLISIVFAIQYFFAAQVNLPKFKLEIPDYIFDQTFKIIEDYIPNSNPYQQVKGVKTDEVLQNQIQIPPELIPYIEKGEFPPEVVAEIEKNLPPGITIEQAMEMLKTAVPQASPQGQETLLSPIRQIVETQINQIIEPYKQFFPAVSALLVFLLLKWFGNFVNLLSTWLLAILTKILLLTKIAKVKTETMQAERIVVE